MAKKVTPVETLAKKAAKPAKTTPAKKAAKKRAHRSPGLGDFETTTGTAADPETWAGVEGDTVYEEGPDAKLDPAYAKSTARHKRDGVKSVSVEDGLVQIVFHSPEQANKFYKDELEGRHTHLGDGNNIGFGVLPDEA